jgi:hypothetical protein
MDNISLVETDQIDSKIQIIMRQTDYTEEKAREKLGEFKFNEISVIRDYFGITEKNIQPKITSVNQAIYKQLRTRLDSSMRDYHERVNKGEAKKII